MDFEFVPSSGNWRIIVRGQNGAVYATLPLTVIPGS
jgi:hypothetical protein